MATIEAVAQWALVADDLKLRLLVQEFLRNTPDLSKVAPPDTTNATVLAVAAGLLELFALRYDQQPPTWTEQIGPAPRPVFLNHDPIHQKWLRETRFKETPQPLKKRRLYAVQNYLFLR